MQRSAFIPRAVVVAAALFSLPALSQTSVPAVELVGFQAIQQDELRQDLTYIASDQLQGRGSLEPGDDTASQWVADQFAKAGLKPIVKDKSGKLSYLSPITLIEFQPDRIASTTTLLRGGKLIAWTYPQAFSSYKQAVDLTAPVVFAGFGITAPELGYDDYASVDVRGKIVLVFDHEPQENDPHSIFNGTGNTRYGDRRVKLLNAQAHGAVALLIVEEPNRTHMSNLERSARVGSANTLGVPMPPQAMQDDELKIPLSLVLDDVANQLFRGSGTTPSAAQTVMDRTLKPQSRLLPDTILRLHLRNSFERTGITNNVVGLLPGSDPTLSTETILITAHHDHKGSRPCADAEHPPVTSPVDPHPCPQIWHGADDNGSGTVGVAELALAFGKNPVKPKRSILFVVFASEERGLLGAYWMAAHPLRPLATTRAQINFDMIGRDELPSPQTEGVVEIPKDTTNRLNLVGAYYSPDYVRTVKEANKAVGLTLDDRFDHEAALDVLFRSDQYPFLLHDIPAFWWFTGFHPDYHHTTDTVDKIDFPKMQKILRLAYLASWQFATESTPPAFVAKPSIR